MGSPLSRELKTLFRYVSEKGYALWRYASKSPRAEKLSWWVRKSVQETARKPWLTRAEPGSKKERVLCGCEYLCAFRNIGPWKTVVIGGESHQSVLALFAREKFMDPQLPRSIGLESQVDPIPRQVFRDYVDRLVVQCRIAKLILSSRHHREVRNSIIRTALSLESKASMKRKSSFVLFHEALKNPTHLFFEYFEDDPMLTPQDRLQPWSNVVTRYVNTWNQHWVRKMTGLICGEVMNYLFLLRRTLYRCGKRPEDQKSLLYADSVMCDTGMPSIRLHQIDFRPQELVLHFIRSPQKMSDSEKKRVFSLFNKCFTRVTREGQDLKMHAKEHAKGLVSITGNADSRTRKRLAHYFLASFRKFRSNFKRSILDRDRFLKSIQVAVKTGYKTARFNPHFLFISMVMDCIGLARMFRDPSRSYRSGGEKVPMKNLAFYGGYHHSICYATFVKEYFSATPRLERFSTRGTHPMKSVNEALGGESTSQL